MGFEPRQHQSHLESVNEFKERMKDALDEAKAALTQSKDDMARYYDRNCIPAQDYQPGDKVYLDASDIQTTRPSKKLSHRRLGPFEVIRKVGNGADRLKLPPSMSRLHPVFNVVKLMTAPADPILGRHRPLPPSPEIINGEEEWIIEEILDSKMVNRKLRYLIKWKGFGIEHNSWEPWNDIHAPELITEFYQKHPGAAHQIRALDFRSIPFRSISPRVLSCHSLERGGGRCQGTLRRFCPFHPFRPFRPLNNFITFPCLYSTSPSLSNTPLFSVNFRVFPLFHLYPSFHFPLSFYSLFFYSLSSYSLFFPSLFLSRVPLFSVLFIV